MHYKEEELYFYMKKDVDGEKAAAIKLHLDSCLECGKKFEKLSRISGFFKSSLQEPPAFVAARAPAKPSTTPPFGSFRLRFAVVATMVIIIPAFIIVGISVKKEHKKGNVEEFVYKTYKTIYDFDYYQENYVETAENLFK